MRELAWALIARIVSHPAVSRRLIARAQRTPYQHIQSADGLNTYMGRWWLFNPYGKNDGEVEVKRFAWLPSVRIHHIMREDQDRDLHDHPWNARTIVLKGWYLEELPLHRQNGSPCADNRSRVHRARGAGQTGRLLFQQYHRIAQISPGGAWTLFITWQYRGNWGFLVDGVKVPWRTYLKQELQA